MKKFFSIARIVLCLLVSRSGAQTPFSTTAVLNVNNIEAMVSVHGDMWRDPTSGAAHCAVPAGSGKNIASTGALWMSGYDAANSLHIAAQTYRQDGNDYWPGPLDGSGALTYATSQSWAKIWSVNRDEIALFKTMSVAGTATPTNTAAAIWEWPAKGNTHAKGNGGVALTITDDMAPFKDVNGDGIYNPDDGDYPDVPGDQNLWWVFSDNGPSHSQTNGQPLKVEVHALAFGFKRWSALDNILYFQYDILNKSTNDYQKFRIGQYADMDLGSPTDDYIGCDTARGLGIVYNGNPTDAVYGTNMPMAGITMRVFGGGIANFIYDNNDASLAGMPTTAIQYDNYLRSKFRDGTHLAMDFAGPGVVTTGYGAGPSTNFAFNGNPADHTQWSECNSGNTPGDRRFILSTGDMTLTAGAKISATIMLLTTDLRPNNACGSANFSSLDSISDVAVAGFDDNYHNMPLQVDNTPAISEINVYPNPANNTLFVDHAGIAGSKTTIIIYNIMGQAMNAPITLSGQKATIDISALPAGLYQVVCRGDVIVTGKFLKE